MHECSVCGLLFLGGAACPSCGSLGNQELDIKGNGKEVIEQRGGIPGMSELNTAMINVVGDEGLTEEIEAEEPTGTSLPFTIGGGASEEVSSLPFGVGSRTAGLPSTESNPEKEETPTIESAISATQDVELLQQQSDNSQTETGESEQWTDVGGELWAVGKSQDDIEQNQDQMTEKLHQELPHSHAEPPARNQTANISEEPAEIKFEATSTGPSINEIKVVHREPVPLPGTAVDELETVPLPSPGLPEKSTENTPKPMKLQAIAIQVDETSEQISEANETTLDLAPTTSSITHSDSDEGHFQIHAAEVDMEQLYAEPEQVVFHDFESEELTSEVQVNLDDMAEEEPVGDVIFAPEHVSSEPELFPAQALEIDTKGDSEMNMLLESGFSALGAGNWEQAARSFRSMAAKDPDSSSILNNYGLALLQHAMGLDEEIGVDESVVDSQYEAAIMALRQSAKSNPEEALILYNLGVALVSSGRHEKAVSILDVVLNRPHSPKVAILNARSAAHIGLGDFDAAKNDLSSALSIEPDNQILKANLSRISPT
ncbi:tetratricopeptide repeat protein [Deltaproteobacteria bacterium]|nr:tetratricopeptide repeat protein [Deltaproteobacteria bacterium]